MLLSLLLYHHYPGKALAYARLAFPLPPRLPLMREVAGAACRRERCSRTAVQPPLPANAIDSSLGLAPFKPLPLLFVPTRLRPPWALSLAKQPSALNDRAAALLTALTLAPFHTPCARHRLSHPVIPSRRRGIS